MAGTEDRVAAHYGKTDLYGRILAGLAAHGVAADAVTADHLKAVDEFHIGGIAATVRLLDPLSLAPGTRLLDIGCGIGGPARHMATAYGAAVTGIDLTPEFIEAARRLTDHVGLSVDFVVGSALDMPFDDDSFDAATLLHVGMNLPDKPKLFAEAARVLRPGGVFAVYDVMRFGDHPAFPVPWATTEAESFLDTPDAYLDAAAAAGFTLDARTDRGEVAQAFFADMQARMAQDGPPPVGLPLLMGDTAPQKVANMVAAVNAGAIQPVEMIFRNAG